MHHDAYTRCEKRSCLDVHFVFHERRKATFHSAKIDAALFENSTAYNYAGSSASTRGVAPGILGKGGTPIFRLQASANFILNVAKLFRNLLFCTHNIRLETTRDSFLARPRFVIELKSIDSG
jgi:hypothetical protein